MWLIVLVGGTGRMLRPILERPDDPSARCAPDATSDGLCRPSSASCSASTCAHHNSTKLRRKWGWLALHVDSTAARLRPFDLAQPARPRKEKPASNCASSARPML